MYAGDINFKRMRKVAIQLLKHLPNCDGFILPLISQNMVSTLGEFINNNGRCKIYIMLTISIWGPISC